MSEALKGNIVAIIDNIPFYLIMFASLLLGKFVYDRTTKFSFDHELTHRDNRSFGALFSLYLLGLILAIGGSVHRGVEYTGTFLLILTSFCILAVVLMRISIWIVDRFVLPSFCIEKEIIKDRNVGTGLVVGGCCVATGLVINGSLSADPTGDSVGARFGSAILDTFLYFVIGQILLVIVGRFYQWISDVDVHHVIEKDDNMAMGLAYGGFLAAVGILVRCSLLAASSQRINAEGVVERNLAIEIPTALAVVVFGIVLLWAARLFADKVLLSKSPLTKEIVVDKNPAAGGVEAACYICASLAFSFALLS